MHQCIYNFVHLLCCRHAAMNFNRAGQYSWLYIYKNSCHMNHDCAFLTATWLCCFFFSFIGHHLQQHLYVPVPCACHVLCIELLKLIMYYACIISSCKAASHWIECCSVSFSTFPSRNLQSSILGRWRQFLILEINIT